MIIKIEKRSEYNRYSALDISILSVLLALAVASIIMWAFRVSPTRAYYEIFVKTLSNKYGISHVVARTIPLLLCSLGLVVCFKAGVWNIGAEGQLLMGAVAATGVALYLMPQSPSWILLPTMFTLGAVMGAFWALIPALLKAKARVNEIITTLMLNYVAEKIVEYLVYGPWKSPSGWGFPLTDTIPDQARLPLIPGTPVHIPTLGISLLSSALVFLVLRKTSMGFELKVYGFSEKVAEYATVSRTKVIVISMVLSGALAGIAGVGEIAGIHYRLRLPRSISGGYGYTGIIVAWLSRLNPLACIPFSLLLSVLSVGSDAIQITLKLPRGVINIFNGLILVMLLVLDFLAKYRIKVIKHE
ncbi:MAG: ABC transporter permease [Thermoprotei archaeon]|nr:MAG: ABC transporter permease [Thermoprotei archaeon]RLE99429.1 MAG: ABC transporter permease [Thermoprotei archaeon]HDI75044.1 ABC transporter permease [Thermoprotei archaeon]